MVGGSAELLIAILARLGRAGLPASETRRNADLWTRITSEATLRHHMLASGNNTTPTPSNLSRRTITASVLPT